MMNGTPFLSEQQVEVEAKSYLDQVVRRGAQRMLQATLEVEVAEYIERLQDMVDASGRRLVVRNGSLPERDIISGAGPLRIRQPRVKDTRKGCAFTSKILPPYMRRTPSIEALIPALYLKGISTGQMAEALEAIVGEGARGLSATTVDRLKAMWEQEYNEWNERDLKDKRYVYWWADGIYFNIRLEPERSCMLVIIGTLADGSKELVAVYDGIRESTLSWREVLRDLKRRGLTEGPKLAVADGALGFWGALAEEFPGAREQRCWVHKTANVLDKLPKSVQFSAKKLIHQMYLSPTKQDALHSYDDFMALYQAKHPKACECLKKDKEVLFTFYDFPAEHWSHIRSTNPIESTFATVRLRTRSTKGCGSRLATLTMVFKLTREAEKHWRKINCYRLIEKIIAGVQFKDGEEIKQQQQAA
jgi:transposase-like protein